jgi:ElaB/YqjD/DUF883 family membrane-anchored ribosome-binding protein
MSNQDPLYGDSSHTDPWQAAPGKSESGTSETVQNATDDALHTGSQAMDTAQQKGQQALSQARQKGEEARDKAEQMAGKAQHRADEGMHKAAEGMDQAAEMLRQRGSEQGGTVGTVASTAADTLGSASSYLRDADTAQMMDQLEEYIRKNPTQSLLIAAGVGFVLSKVFK